MKRTIFACKLIGIGFVLASGQYGHAAVSKQVFKVGNGDVICNQFSTSLDIDLESRLPAPIDAITDCQSSYHAQVPPSSERFPQSPPDVGPLPPGQAPLLPDLTVPESPPEDVPTDVFVADIQVTGSTIFDDADFAEVLASYEGRSLTPGELAEAANGITQLYLQRGYITTRAQLKEGHIIEGVVEIQVIEGQLEIILVEGNRNLQERYIRDRVALAAGKPLNQIALEEQLRLLQTDPLIKTIEASLKAGSDTGLSILTVQVQEANPLGTRLSFDNYSPDSVGANRAGAEISYLSPLGLGDKLFTSARVSTTGGSEIYDIGYRVPLNALDGTLQLGFTASNFEITDSEASLGLDIDGSTDIFNISFRQPLVRSLREEFALSVGFRRRVGETFIFDTVVDSSRTSVLQFGQDYLKRDLSGAWALRSQFNIGTGLFAVTDRPDDQADAQFFSWLGQVQRVQLLNDKHTLIIQGDLQLAGDPLLPSEQFILGGGQSLRGYEQNSLFGDNGFRLSIEDRITVDRDTSGQPKIQVAPFIDMGAVWNNEDNQSDREEDFLIGLGTGVIWEPLPGLNTRLDFAIPLISSDGNQQGFFFSIIYRP